MPGVVKRTFKSHRFAGRQPSETELQFLFFPCGKQCKLSVQMYPKQLLQALTVGTKKPKYRGIKFYLLKHLKRGKKKNTGQYICHFIGNFCLICQFLTQQPPQEKNQHILKKCTINWAEKCVLIKYDCNTELANGNYHCICLKFNQLLHSQNSTTHPNLLYQPELLQNDKLW